MEEFDFLADSPSDKGKDNRDNKQRVILFVLVSFVVLLAGSLVYLYMRNGSIQDENDRLIAEYEEEKDILTDKILALQADLDTLYSDNAAMTSKLDSSRIEVQLLIDKLSETEATNRSKMRQYEKELGTLRSIMKDYVRQIDSLNIENQKLTTAAAAARKEAADSKKKTEELTKTVANLSNKVNVGAQLKAYGITTQAYSKSDKTTDRSSRTAYLITSLTLGENDLAEKGPVMVYVRVKDPDGFLLVGETQRTFEYNGEMMSSSASREVDYQGAAVDMSIYLHDVPSYSKGVYTVEVYSDKTLFGTTELMLR
jgi:peptidoglycan hydrolase CwlO-like protein